MPIAGKNLLLKWGRRFYAHIAVLKHLLWKTAPLISAVGVTGHEKIQRFWS
jgi:hypothetical protein